LEHQTVLLLEHARRGDRQSSDALFRIWYPPAYRMALRCVADPEMAREAVQIAFIAVFDRLEQLQQPEKFAGWLYRTVINCCRMEQRKQRRARIDPMETAPVQAGESQRADRDLHLEERNRLLMDAVWKLPDDQRTVLILKELEDMKFREIAEVLAVPENTVKTRLYTALKNLKQILEKGQLVHELYYEV
jgi:RNA polymerase sigma-70 factor, ECF subfamily